MTFLGLINPFVYIMHLLKFFLFLSRTQATGKDHETSLMQQGDGWRVLFSKKVA